MSKNYTQSGIGPNVELGKNGSHINDNQTAPGGGSRVEVRESDNTTPSRTAGANAQEPDEYITLAQFQAQSKWIDPVRALADSNVASLSGPATIDTINLVAGDRVALTNQTNPIENGVWVVQAGAWTRPGDFDTGASASNRTFFAEEGATYADTAWTVTTDPPNDIIDTDPLALVQIAGPGAITTLQNIGAGTGLLPAGVNGPGLVTVSALGAGVGISSITGGLGAGDAVIASVIQGNATPGTQQLVLSQAAGAATQLRDVVDTGSVTWTLDGNGNLQANAAPASAGLPYDTIYYVSLTGNPAAANGGLDVNEPTDFPTALANANAAGNAMIALLDQGTYTNGGPISITGDNVSIVSFVDAKVNGAPPVTISDSVAVNAIGFTSKGINYSDTVTVNAAGAAFMASVLTAGCDIAAPANAITTYEDCVFGAALTTSGAASGNNQVRVVGCSFNAGGIGIGHTGAGTVTAFVQGCPLVIGGISCSQNVTGTTNVFVSDCGNIQNISCTHAGTGAFNLNVSGVDDITAGISLASTNTGDNAVGLANIRACGALTDGPSSQLYTINAHSVGFTGSVGLNNGSGDIANFQSCIVNGGGGAVNTAAGYNTKISDTAFDRGASTIGTENTGLSGVTSDFSSAKIQAQSSAEVAPPVLVLNPTADNLVESVPFSTFQSALSAGQGINPTQLASPNDTIQTADPIESTQTPGVELTLYRPFTSQGNGTLAVGALPAGSYVTSSKLTITSAATAGNVDLGYNGGTGTELQNGATDNDVTSADTYVADDVVFTAGAQNVELDFTGMTGTADGFVVVKYFVGA